MTPLPVFVAHVGCGSNPARCHMLEHTLDALMAVVGLETRVQADSAWAWSSHGSCCDTVLPRDETSQRDRRAQAIRWAQDHAEPLVVIADDDVVPLPTTEDGIPWVPYVRDYFDRHPGVSQLAPFPMPDPCRTPHGSIEAMDATVGGFRIVRVADAKPFAEWPAAAPATADKYDAEFSECLTGRSVLCHRWWAIHLDFKVSPGGRYDRGVRWTGAEPTRRPAATPPAPAP